MGSTVSIIIRIRNLTTTDITSLHAYDIDGFDFGRDNRPDLAFTGLSLPSGRCIERTIELNSIATNCPFAMKMTFRNGLIDDFKINAKCVFDSTEANLRYLKKSHCVYHKKTAPRILEIIVKHTEAQLQNLQAEELISEATVLLAAGKYHEASIKLLEAAQKANKDETKDKIRRNRQELEGAKGTDVDRKAEAVNDEGMQLLKENKYQQAVKKFEEALNIAKNVYTISLIEYNLKTAKDAKANQDAKKLNQEGLVLKKHNQIDEAIQKFDEALKLALDDALTNSIRTHKAETLNLEAMTELDNGWSAEETEDSIYKFARAKFLFEEADSLRHSQDYQKSIEIIDKKVEGDKIFNIALQFEKEATRLVDKTAQCESVEDCQLARNKYEEALKSYSEAKKKYEEGLKMGDVKFEMSVQVTDVALSGIEKILKELKKAELEIASKR